MEEEAGEKKGFLEEKLKSKKKDGGRSVITVMTKGTDCEFFKYVIGSSPLSSFQERFWEKGGGGSRCKKKYIRHYEGMYKQHTEADQSRRMVTRFRQFCQRKTRNNYFFPRSHL